MSEALVRDLSHGLMSDFTDTEYPSLVYGIDNGDPIVLTNSGTLFGFVWTGSLSVHADDTKYEINAFHYFSIPFGERVVLSGSARGFFVVRQGYRGLPSVGGPVESKGRLRYIDGCSDTLLISPVVKGDPCFNLLHFPAGIDQTKHTHPTIRAGLVHGGEGRCLTASGVEDLKPGRMFILYPDAIHAFSTEGYEGMNLTVFHPDSDFGPSHEEHPMLNRTIVDGVSARHIDEIRTKELT
jgi:quercetin dioxygenase-like cupin family protein